MVYAAKRSKNRCPTHPGELLRDDIIPATGRTKADPGGTKAGISRHRGAPRQGFRRWRWGLDQDAGCLRYVACGTDRRCQSHSYHQG
jgi:hypothetical protein